MNMHENEDTGLSARRKDLVARLLEVATRAPKEIFMTFQRASGERETLRVVLPAPGSTRVDGVEFTRVSRRLYVEIEDQEGDEE